MPFRQGEDSLTINSSETIRRILDECRTIAVVGLSSDSSRASNNVSAYMKRNGYRVIPVNPNETSVFGEKAFPEKLFHQTRTSRLGSRGSRGSHCVSCKRKRCLKHVKNRTKDRRPRSCGTRQVCGELF